MFFIDRKGKSFLAASKAESDIFVNKFTANSNWTHKLIT